MPPFTLNIDISDKTSVAAAIPLLQLMLGYSFTAAPDAGSAVAVQAASAATVFGSPAALPLGVPVAQDAAAVFGVAPLPLAPTGAGVLPPLTAPGVQPLSFQPPPAATGFVAPAPAAVAPMGMPFVPPPTAAQTVELDSEGLPWDERIHAGTKTKTVPGAWKAKKGVNDAAFVNGIKAELRARMAGGHASPAAVVAQPVAAGVLPPLGAGPFVPPAASLPPAVMVAPSAPVIPTTFEEFMQRITVACSGGVVPMEAVNAAVEAYKLPSITSLQTNLSYVPHVWQYLQSQYPALA